MKSRVERYYENDSDMPSRSSKNQDLYSSVSKEDNFIRDEIALDNNEIDISKIKNNFSNREEYQRVKEYQETFSIDNSPSYDVEEYSEPEEIEEDKKIYDINSILENAKQSREKLDVEQKYKRLKNTSYDILSNLDLGMKDTEEDLENTIIEETKELNINPKPKTQEDELRNLINTITMQKVADDEGLTQVDLEKELLNEVHKDNNIEPPKKEPQGIFEIKEQNAKKDIDKAREIDEQLQRTIQELKDEKAKLEKKVKQKEYKKEAFEYDDEDEDFFTSSYKFSSKDFRKGKSENKNKNKNKNKPQNIEDGEAKLGLGAKILIILLIVVIILVFIYLFNLIFIA